MSAFDTQEGGGHYKKLKIQPMQYSMANGLDACQHTIVKYVTRFRDKGGIEDLKKAKHCIDMLIELEGDRHVMTPGYIEYPDAKQGRMVSEPYKARTDDYYYRAPETKEVKEAMEEARGMAGSGPWVDWGGGHCPLEECVLVKVQFRNGGMHKGYTETFFWEHDEDSAGSDIIAYRVLG